MRVTRDTIAPLILAALLSTLLVSCSSASRPTTTSTDSPLQEQPTQQQDGKSQPRPVTHRAHEHSAQDIGQAEAQWFNQLKTGAILYDVPAQMTLGEPSTVSVTITGYQAPAPQSANPGAEVAPLKVSNFMRVTIDQNDNPDEFTIAHGQNADDQFVPVNSSATWTWTVTPKHLGKNLKLRLQAFVIYQDPKLGIQQSFPAASREVTVVTQGVRGIVSNAKDNFWSDPAVWIKYMLPGGAGFATLAAIIAWWIKRKKPDPGKEK